MTEKSGRDTISTSLFTDSFFLKYVVVMYAKVQAGSNVFF